MRFDMRRSIAAGIIFLILIVALVIACDPIDRFAIRQSFRSINTMGWDNGLWSLVRASDSAAPEDVVRAEVHDLSPQAVYKIIELKKIWIYSASNPLFAALVDNDGVRKIYVFRDKPDQDGEWSMRTYDP
jgi:hypothetical protein